MNYKWEVGLVTDGLWNLRKDGHFTEESQQREKYLLDVEENFFSQPSIQPYLHQIRHKKSQSSILRGKVLKRCGRRDSFHSI